MPWTFHHSTGKLCNRADQCVANGYSGMAGTGKNNPAMQNVMMVGPIPRGGYMIETPFNDPIHGPYAMHLTPDAANVMYGIDGFLMHGDSLEHPGAS